MTTIALGLTAIGVFGVMAQAVGQRTAEIGIRVALGAKRRDVLGLILGRGLVVTGIGVGVGIGTALLLTRVMNVLLYQVAPNDPVTLVTVAAVLTVVALVACYLPAGEPWASTRSLLFGAGESRTNRICANPEAFRALIARRPCAEAA